MAPHVESVLSGEYDIPYFPMYKPKILDIGANIGAFSIWAYYRWPGCEIKSFEPHHENYEMLKANTRTYNNIYTYNEGIGAPGVRTLYGGKYNCGEASFFRSNATNEEEFLVDVISPLELPTANIIKIDTEGCELEILKPMIGCGRNFSAIMVEYHSLGDKEAIERLLFHYVLVGAKHYDINHGVLRYMSKGVL